MLPLDSTLATPSNGVRARSLIGRIIDLRGGAAGAALLATSVWLINIFATSPPDWFGASTAALKQGAYTFLVGGVLVRLVTYCAVRPGSTWFAITSATIGPGSLGCLFTYLVHSLKGTPSPLLSTVPTILLTVIGIPLIALYKRRQAFKNIAPA